MFNAISKIGTYNKVITSHDHFFGIVICLTILLTTPGIVLSVSLISLLTSFIAL